MRNWIFKDLLSICILAGGIFLFHGSALADEEVSCVSHSGDANSDGEVNILDVVSIVGHILGSELSEEEQLCVDTNSDEKIDILDVVSVVNLILSGESSTDDETCLGYDSPYKSCSGSISSCDDTNYTEPICTEVESTPTEYWSPTNTSGECKDSPYTTDDGLVEVTVIDEDSGGSDPDESGCSFVCRPAGLGVGDLVPGVLYSHGGMGKNVGGDLEETCINLAKEGYIARSEKRWDEMSFSGHLTQVEESLTALRDESNIDSENIALMGFSRGALLTVGLALSDESIDLYKSVIFLSPADGNQEFDAWDDGGTFLNTWLEDKDNIEGKKVLILSVNNDNRQDEHVCVTDFIYQSFIDAGANEDDITYTVLPNFWPENCSGDGHEVFWTVNDNYWGYITTFLEETIGAD